MLPTFLKRKTIEVNGQSVEISQLSGMDRFEYLDWMSELNQPEIPEPPANNQDAEAEKAYIKEMMLANKEWQKIAYQCHCRLIAHSLACCVDGIEKDVNSVYQRIIQILPTEDAKMLHDEVAKLSGMQSVEDYSETEQSPVQDKPSLKN